MNCMALLHLFGERQTRLADFSNPRMQIEKSERSKQDIVASRENAVYPRNVTGNIRLPSDSDFSVCIGDQR